MEAMITCKALGILKYRGKRGGHCRRLHACCLNFLTCDLATNVYKSTYLDLAINDECDQDLSLCKSIRVLIARNRPGLEILNTTDL